MASGARRTIADRPAGPVFVHRFTKPVFTIAGTHMETAPEGRRAAGEKPVATGKNRTSGMGGPSMFQGRSGAGFGAMSERREGRSAGGGARACHQASIPARHAPGRPHARDSGRNGGPTCDTTRTAGGVFDTGRVPGKRPWPAPTPGHSPGFPRFFVARPGRRRAPVKRLAPARVECRWQRSRMGDRLLETGSCRRTPTTDHSRHDHRIPNTITGGVPVSTGWQEVQIACRGWSAGHVKSRPSFNCRSSVLSGCLIKQPRAMAQVGRASQSVAKSDSPRFTAWYGRG